MLARFFWERAKFFPRAATAAAARRGHGRVSLNPTEIARRSLVLIVSRRDARPPSCLLFHRGKRIAAKSAARPYHPVASVITMREHVNPKRSGDASIARDGPAPPGGRAAAAAALKRSRGFAISPQNVHPL